MINLTISLSQYLSVFNFIFNFATITYRKEQKRMKTRTYFLIAMATLLATPCLAQKQDGKATAKYLINGYFFESMPEIPESVAAKGLDTVLVLTDNDGNEVESYKYAEELPKSVARQALPKKRVRNARFFLREDEHRRNEIFKEQQMLADANAVRGTVPCTGQYFPLFNERDSDGKPWTYQDLEGHLTVLYLWQSGNVQSLSEMNELSAWKQMYPDVLFLSATWQDPATVSLIAHQYNFTWTHLCSAHAVGTWMTQGIPTDDGSICRTYPVTIVVDYKGIVRRVISGTGMDRRQAILQCIQRYR